MKRRASEVDDGNTRDRNTRRHVEGVDDHTSDAPIRKLSFPPKDRPGAPVPFQQPSQLLSFSYTPAHELEFTDAALRYYVSPPVGADLRYGYERWVKRPEEKGRLDALLKAIDKYRTRIDAGGASGDAWLRDMSIVSWRGVMTKILTAPYEERDPWELNVMLVNGTMYFEEHSSDAKLVEKEDMTPHHRLQSYYGYAFESYCTSSIPDRHEPPVEGHPHVPGWGGDVNTNVQWCSVVKTKLGGDRIVIGGEVDCVRGKYTGRPDTFVELKTSMNIRGPQDEARFEKKLLKFYFQSFLLGVPEIVVGFRKPSGQLTTVQTFQTIQLPRLVRGKPDAWDPSVCLSWGERFIRFLKSEVSERTETGTTNQVGDAAALSVWRVKFEPGVGVSVVELDEEGVREVEGREDRIGFLPRWYLRDLGVLLGVEAEEAAAGPASLQSPSGSPPHVSDEKPPENLASVTPQSTVVAGWNI